MFSKLSGVNEPEGSKKIKSFSDGPDKSWCLINICELGDVIGSYTSNLKEFSFDSNYTDVSLKNIGMLSVTSKKCSNQAVLRTRRSVAKGFLIRLDDEGNVWVTRRTKCEILVIASFMSAVSKCTGKLLPYDENILIFDKLLYNLASVSNTKYLDINCLISICFIKDLNCNLMKTPQKSSALMIQIWPFCYISAEATKLVYSVNSVQIQESIFYIQKNSYLQPSKSISTLNDSCSNLSPTLTSSSTMSQSSSLPILCSTTPSKVDNPPNKTEKPKVGILHSIRMATADSIDFHKNYSGKLMSAFRKRNLTKPVTLSSFRKEHSEICDIINATAMFPTSCTSDSFKHYYQHFPSSVSMDTNVLFSAISCPIRGLLIQKYAPHKTIRASLFSGII